MLVLLRLAWYDLEWHLPCMLALCESNKLRQVLKVHAQYWNVGSNMSVLEPGATKKVTCSRGRCHAALIGLTDVQAAPSGKRASSGTTGRSNATGVRTGRVTKVGLE